MVFESVVTDVLNKILGDYVENLDKKQLKIGIWGGDVVLNNLQLRENALDDLDLPIKLIYGYLGKLVLRIPWKNLYSQPVVAQIEDFFLLISPKQSQEYNAEKEAKYDLQAKQTALQAIDEAFKMELEKDKPKADATFTEKLTAQIVNNLQVKISNVHIRYEDMSTTGRPFCFGISLNDLELSTTDENWQKCYVAEQVSRTYKIANLDSLAAYMNCQAEMFGGFPQDRLPALFRSNIASRETTPADYTYVLGPISSVAKLQLNMNPEYNQPPFALPKIDLCLEMEKLNVGLTSTQFLDIMKLADSMNRMQLGAPYRKYRPFNTPYKGNYKQWWKFAITAVLEEEVRKKNREWSWENMQEHRQLCSSYAENLKERELAKKPQASLVEACSLLESRLDLFNLILIRQRVLIDVNRIKKEEEKTAKPAAGWFGGWFGGGNKNKDVEEGEDIAKRFESAMTNEEKEKLYKAIGYEANAAPMHLPEDYEAIKMNFKLIAFEIGLYDDSKYCAKPYTEARKLSDLETLMLLRFSMATCNLSQRPAASALSLTAGMKDMRLTGLAVDNRGPPTMIESIVSHEDNLLDIFFETNPLDKKCDQRVRVRARPLQIIYDSATILKLIKVFSPPPSVHLSELEGAATAKIANFKQRSATGMQYMIDSHSILDVDIALQPSILLVPDLGIYNEFESTLLVVSLGKVNVTSKPREGTSVKALNESGFSEDKILESVIAMSYDTFNVSINDIQILIARPEENWSEALVMNDNSDMHILRPTSILVNADLCVVADDPRLPKTKVEIVLPAININMTEERIFEALSVLTSLPTPEGAPEAQPLKRAVTSASLLSLATIQKRMATKPKAKGPAITTEVVQYTDLQLNFALKEFSVTLHKSRTVDSPTESTRFCTPSQETPPGNDEFADTHSTVAEPFPETEKLLSLRFLQLEVEMVQRTYEMVATAKLGAINMTQYHSFNNKDFVYSIIDTPRFTEQSEYLLTVSYMAANKDSPEFTTKYNSTEQLIRVNFSTLNVVLHQECLLVLMAIANTLQTKLNERLQRGKDPMADRIGDAGEGEGIINKLATILEEDDEPEEKSPAKLPRRHHQHVVESIKIHLVANMEQVSLLLTCRKRDLASLRVQHFNAGVVLKSSYTEVNLCLKDIFVTDLNPKNIHTNILSIVGNNALSCQVVLYNLDETSNYNSDDMKINVEIGCMRIVFINWFVTSVLSFLNHFQAAQQILADASAAAADAAKQNALDAYDKATRMKLNIRIKAPIIIVPVDSQSHDGLALDLGSIYMTNTTSEVSVPQSEHSPAVMDEIKMELKDMKLSRVRIVPEVSGSADSITLMHSVDTVDFAYGINSKMSILKPISFTFLLKRNLSAKWYHDLPEMDVSGRLRSIEMNLLMDDYSLIMSIVNRNLSEGAREFPPVKQPEQSRPGASMAAERSSLSVRRKTNSPGKKVPSTPLPNEKVYEQLKFNFQFDGIIVNLLTTETTGLACFGIYFLSVKGTQLVNGTLSTSLVLCNIQIEDTRPDSKSKITKYLCRKDWRDSLKLVNTDAKQIVDECQMDRNYMVDVTAIIKENDTFAEVRVSGFDLIMCIDYMLKLADFFKLPEDESTPAHAPHAVPDAKALMIRPSSMAVQSVMLPPPPPPPVGHEKKMTLVLHVEEPDIILIESLEDTNTNAIIFNAQANLNYRAIGDKQLINGEIVGMKMYMCAFKPERREATTHYIIHPCEINLHGNTPDEDGLHIHLGLSDIIINVSPATIELFNKAMLTVTTSNAEKALEQKKEVNFSDIWSAQRFDDDDYWFIKADEADEAVELARPSQMIVPFAKKSEKCVIEVPCITLVVETGVGYYTTPLIMIDTQLNAVASDWSYDLKVSGSLSLSMNYYNQSLAVWEPIIEQNEQRGVAASAEPYSPWELKFNMAIESKPSEFDDDQEEKATFIKIHSEETLELTLSKSCLNVLTVIGQAFSEAIDAKGVFKPEVSAPYVLENDTGFDISVNFGRGIFTLHECHMPKGGSTTNSLNRSLVFQAADLSEQNVRPEQVRGCVISGGGRAYLQTKVLSTVTSPEDEEYNLYVKVGGIDKEIVLPASQNVKRYFPLYRDTNSDPWGIVSEVRSEYGTTKVNIHGVVNVQNHFTTTLRVYRNKGLRHSEKVFVGEIPAGEVYHVPLHAIYSETKDLFFSLDGYKTSVQGIKWNDCPTDLAYQRQLQCDPIDTFEVFYMNVMREKTEIFYENTSKFKLMSAFYTIHIKPPLYLRNALPIGIKVSVAGCSVRQAGSELAVDASSPQKLEREDLLDYGEKEVKPGDSLQLPTVRLSCPNKEAKSYLVVRLIQYLEKDWSCTTEISGEQKDLATWKFTSYDSAAKMEMDLCVRFDDRQGSVMVTIYSPFWMVNKTGLMLSYKTDMETVDVLYHPPEYQGPILFSFREKFFFDKKSATIRVDNGEWSKKIPLDVAGSIGEVTCRANDMSYQIGVHNHLTNNSLTKQITFIPFYIATNKCEFTIELQEQSRPGDPWVVVKPNDCVPLWPKNDSDMMMIAKVQGQRSRPFNFSDIQCTLLQLEHNKYGGINVDVQTTEGGVYINFTEYFPGDAPGLIINHTSLPLVYEEKGAKEQYTLQPNHRVLYTWSDPAGEKKILFGQNVVVNDLRRDGVGEVFLEKNRSAYWVSFLDGLQRVLLITEIESIAKKSETSSALQTITQSIELHLHGIGLSVVNNETGVDIMYLGVTSSGVIWESKKDNKKRFKAMNMHDTEQIEAFHQQDCLNKQVDKERSDYLLDGKHKINFDAMTLMKAGSLREIRRTFYPGVWVNMKSSPFQTQLHAKINKIQLDNQLTDCIFPVVLAPIAPPKSVAQTTALKPFVECSVVQRVVPNSNVKQFKYACVLIQEFHFKVDLPFLTAIADMFAGRLSDDQAAKLFNEDVQSIERPLSTLVEFHSMQEQKNFYDNIHLGPLKIHVSFSMAGLDASALPGIMSTLVQGVGVTLTDVNDVVFRLAFFEREFQFFTQQQLTSEITAHYTGQALKQLYVLVLGLDVLGNPYGLVVGFKKGVEDLFYEPFQGAIQGPGEFAEGLVLGVKSLFGHTVGGAAGAVSKITGAMGKGLAALTFDDDYQKKRRQNLNRKPANFQEGIARSGKGLVMGFVDGVTGVVTKPVTGAREEGVEGFFKGLGKGAIGLVARPTAGVVDFASGSFEAVKRAAEAGEDAQRLRPPRFIPRDAVLRPYCLSQAKGNKLLKEIEKGKYANTDTFVHCEEIVQRQENIIVSNHRVLYTTKNDLFGTWAVQWSYLWHEIASIESTGRGVEIKLKKEGKKVMGLFSTSESQRKVILMPHKEKRDKLVEKMESQRKEN